MSTNSKNVANGKKTRKPMECLYCGQNHPYHLCKHPDVIQFSKYLENFYRKLYVLPVSLNNKYTTAYNMLLEYSLNLIVTAGRNAVKTCHFIHTYRNKVNLNKNAIINNLTTCMFNHMRRNYPNLVEGKPIIVKKSFVNSVKQSFRDTFMNKKTEPEPSAPPQKDINFNEKNYTDMHKPSAPPMSETGGKPRRTRKRSIKNNKSKRRH